METKHWSILISVITILLMATATMVSPAMANAQIEPVTWSVETSPIDSGRYRPMALGDINNDGYLDIVVSPFKSHYASGIRIWLGDGAGGILKVFQEKGFEVFGCDFGNEYLEYGRKKGLSLFNGDSSILHNICKADIIILSHILEHCRNPVETIKGLKPLLKKYGIIYIALLGILSIRENYGDLLMYLQNAHIFHYTLGTLDYTLSLAGFRRIYGNEEIRSVYRENETEKRYIIVPGKEFRKVKRYLSQLEKERNVKEVIKRIIRLWK